MLYINQGDATSFYIWSMTRIRLKSHLGSKQRIANCSCAYLLVSALCDILNKTWFMRESDTDRGDDKSSRSVIISDAGS